MAAKNVGAIMVIETIISSEFLPSATSYFGSSRGLDAQATRLADVMTRAPHTVEDRFRHLTVMQDGKLIGIVSVRSAMDPELEEFASEAHRRKHFGKER